jgi:hypothetical protein
MQRVKWQLNDSQRLFEERPGEELLKSVKGRIEHCEITSPAVANYKIPLNRDDEPNSPTVNHSPLSLTYNLTERA